MKSNLTVNIGEYVNETYYKTYTKAFEEQFLDLKFTVKASLISKVVSSSIEIKGIRFMWGLLDVKNPNSAKLFLIPCGARTDSNLDTYPLLFEEMYFDAYGQSYSVFEVCESISNFVCYIQSHMVKQPYKYITRGGFMGRNKLMNFLEHANSTTIQIALGYNPTNYLIFPLFSVESIYGEFYMNFTRPCPPMCDSDGDDCIATLATEEQSLKKELDMYRLFRDTYLLDIPDGGTYFELYYFISPLMSAYVLKSDNKQDKLNTVYDNYIKPFKCLVDNEDYYQAFEFLKETLHTWLGAKGEIVV